MAHKVKCLVCGQMFDRDNVPCVKQGNRYAHIQCTGHAEGEAADFRRLTDLIQQLYKPLDPDWKLITAQIKRYKQSGKTYMGMYYTLSYFFIVKKNDIRKGKGIGIIPYVYNEARTYYTRAQNTHTKTEDIKNRSKLDISQNENVITLVNKKPKKKLLDFNYDD